MKRHHFFMQKIRNLICQNCTLYHHQNPAQGGLCYYTFKLFWIEVNFWRETLQEISSGQIGYYAFFCELCKLRKLPSYTGLKYMEDPVLLNLLTAVKDKTNYFTILAHTVTQS